MILCDIDDFMPLLIFLGLAWSIFIICLAFKVYGACNNIKRIADKYDPEHKRGNSHVYIEHSRPGRRRLKTRDEQQMHRPPMS